VAAQFSVCSSFVDKLLPRQRTSGSLAAPPARGGPVPRLDPAGRDQLTACLVQQPDATLAELRTALTAAEDPALSRTSRWRAVESLGWGRKKKSVPAAERDTERVVALRGLFVEAVQEADFTRCVFVAETSTNLTYCRRYGRAPAGRRLDQAGPLHSGPNVPLIAALTPDGLGALRSVNGAVFAAYLAQVPGPTLRPGDVVVLDNLSVHKVDGLDQIVQSYGARLL